jgi:transcriptional regulator with XRE-family HTH domain
VRRKPDSSLATLGRHVREFRQELGWSQERLADEADLHRNYVGAIERGELNPTLRNIVRLANALGTTVCGLLPDD